LLENILEDNPIFFILAELCADYITIIVISSRKGKIIADYLEIFWEFYVKIGVFFCKWKWGQ